jgi:aryl-alcohol dehydrogenase-like predicted oxidoreductase
MNSNQQKTRTIPRVELGNTGIFVSQLAFGTGSDGWQGQSKQSDLGTDRLAALLRSGYELGINFWDTADAYGTHPHIAKALENVPRDQVVIVTKTLSIQGDQVKRDLDRFLKELNTDTIDILLLHVMTHADWPKRYAAAMQVLSEAKQKGIVRALGVSCHSLKALKATLDTDWCEVVMARINHAGVNMDASPEKVAPVLDKLFAAGKGVYGMKILGNGRLTGNVDKAIRYAFSLGNIHAMTIGMTSIEQLNENIRSVSNCASQYPLLLKQ